MKYSVIQLSSVSQDKQRKIAMKGEKLMAVIGAILGDIAGSQFEFNRPENLDYKHYKLFTNRCSHTDDTIMTLAVKKQF